MFFYNPSVRTRLSFEAAATELGGHAQFMTPSAGRFKTQTQAGETVEDAAKVMARYVAGIGIRILEDKVPYYGAGNEMLREYAAWADVPIINMADDRFHPCQGMADVMGWAEWFGEGPGRPAYGELKGRTFLLTWGSGALARSWCSVQAALLVASRFGMDVTIARPEGYDLDPQVYEWTKANCQAEGRAFNIVDDPESGYEGAHIVYSRNWVTADAYQDGLFQKQAEIDKAMAYQGWTATAERMARTDNAIYTHPMPVDRGSEVTDEVASGPRSAIYDIAENRLHVQKALMALTMGDW
jgi:N-acetylornithine carbamoyltransferase